MFGIGFTELILISIVAILFLGPDKLPETMVEIAKFIKNIKKTVSEAKSSLEEEIKIADLKEEALNYKKQLDDATNELKGFRHLRLDDYDDETTYDDEISKSSPTETVSAAQKHRLQVLKEAASVKKEANTLTDETSHETKQVPEEIKTEVLATQVEPKQNETITMKKKPKEKKIKNNKTANNEKIKQSKGDA